MDKQMKRELLDALIPIMYTLQNAGMLKLYDLAAILRAAIVNTPTED